MESRYLLDKSRFWKNKAEKKNSIFHKALLSLRDIHILQSYYIFNSIFVLSHVQFVFTFNYSETVKVIQNKRENVTLSRLYKADKKVEVCKHPRVKQTKKTFFRL